MPKSSTAPSFDFVDSACHELKTPLTSIKIYDELIKKNIAGNSKNLPVYLNKLDQNVNKLTLLLNNFSSLIKLQHQRLSPQNFTYSLPDLLAQSLTFNYRTDPSAVNLKISFDLLIARQIFNSLFTFFGHDDLFLIASANQPNQLYLTFYHGKKSPSVSATPITTKPLAMLPESRITSQYIAALLNYYQGRITLYQDREQIGQLLGYIFLPIWIYQKFLFSTTTVIF